MYYQPSDLGELVGVLVLSLFRSQTVDETKKIVGYKTGQPDNTEK